MSRAAVIILLALALVSGAVWSQGNTIQCAAGLPCGSVPWQLPRLPRLATPTPIPTINAPDYSGLPLTQSPTPTPMMATGTPFFDSNAIGQQVGTLQAVINSTPFQVYSADGSGVPSDINSTIAQVAAMGGNTNIFFSYVRALYGVNIGVFTPLMLFFLIRFAVMLIIRLNTLILPVALAIFGFIRKVVQLILDFLPL